MSNTRKLFNEIEPPKGLFTAVWGKIEEEKVKSARQKAFFSSIVSIFSLISLFETGQYLATELYRTGFYDYASLLISDLSSISYFWREFAISLAESLPVSGFVLLFGIIAVFLVSTKFIIKNLENINYLAVKRI